MVFSQNGYQNSPKLARGPAHPVGPQKNRKKNMNPHGKSLGSMSRFRSNRSNRSRERGVKGAQATQPGGPPDLALMAPREESEGECFAPCILTDL